MIADRLLNRFSGEPGDMTRLENELSGVSADDLAAGEGEFDLEQFYKSLSFLSKGNILGSLLKTIPGLPDGVSVDRESGSAAPIHVFLEACFHRRPVARSKKIGTLILQFHTRKV